MAGDRIPDRANHAASISALGRRLRPVRNDAAHSLGVTSPPGAFSPGLTDTPQPKLVRRSSPAHFRLAAGSVLTVWRLLVVGIADWVSKDQHH